MKRMSRRIFKDAGGQPQGGSELRDLAVDRVDAVDNPAHGGAFLILKNAEGDGSASQSSSTGADQTALKSFLSGLDPSALSNEQRTQATALAKELGVTLKEAMPPGKGKEEDDKKNKKPPFLKSEELEEGVIERTIHPDGTVVEKVLKKPGEKGSAPQHVPPVSSGGGTPTGSGSGTADATNMVDVTKFKSDIVEEVMDALAPLLKTTVESITGKTVEVTKSAPASKQAQGQDGDGTEVGSPQDNRRVTKHGEGVFTSVIFGQK